MKHLASDSAQLAQSLDGDTKMIAELILVRRWKRVTRRDLVNYCQTFKKADERQRRRATDFLVDMVRKRQLPVIGGGTGIWSFIEITDAAAATLAAVERGAPGVYNVADSDPASPFDPTNLGTLVSQ